jgi:hypothetical protein
VAVWLGNDDISLDFDFSSFMADTMASMDRRIDSRTKGLLEIYDTAGVRSSRIDYLHRTAREWVKALLYPLCLGRKSRKYIKRVALNSVSNVIAHSSKRPLWQ